MHRGPVLVRSATTDVESLSPLWAEFRELDATGHGTGALAVPSGLDIGERVRERIVESGGRGRGRRTPDVPVGGGPRRVRHRGLRVVLRGRPLLATAPVVVVDLVHVTGSQRKKGVGTQLLRCAVAFADEVGAADVVVNVPPSARDVNRFYARIGFSPMVVRRSAPVGQLRRRLGVEPRLDPRDATVDLTPVQRSLRSRTCPRPAAQSPADERVRPQAPGAVADEAGDAARADPPALVVADDDLVAGQRAAQADRGGDAGDQPERAARWWVALMSRPTTALPSPACRAAPIDPRLSASTTEAPPWSRP